MRGVCIMYKESTKQVRVRNRERYESQQKLTRVCSFLNLVTGCVCIRVKIIVVIITNVSFCMRRCCFVDIVEVIVFIVLLVFVLLLLFFELLLLLFFLLFF